MEGEMEGERGRHGGRRGGEKEEKFKQTWGGRSESEGVKER